jgi:hypothetical protein
MLMQTLLASLLTLALATGVQAEDGRRVQFLGMHSQVPAAWLAEEVASSMRVLQYRIPGAGDTDDGQFVLYYFGPTQGGSLEANLDRWTSQFSRPDGGEVEAVIDPLEGRFPAKLVQLEGDYARGVGMGPAGEALPDRMLLAAVVESPKGNLYPQLHGPAQLVKELRKDFIAFIEGMQADAAP